MRGRGRSARLDVRPPEQVGAPWQRLWERVPGATPFASPAWLVPWARHYAPGRCWVATRECAGELVACLPVFWWQGRVLLAGTGPSDHGGMLAVPGFESAAAELLDAVLAALDRPVERVELHQLPRSSPLLAMPAPPGWHDRLELGVACPALTLRDADGMGNVGKRMRRNWRYAMHAVARGGGRLDLAPATDARRGVADLERLHGMRWAQRGERGVFADPLLRPLLEDAASTLASAGMLRLHRLMVEDRAVAVLFALHGDGCTCCYLSGFDPACGSLSPVTALIGATVAQAAREQDRSVDFLRGDEPYKYAWGATAATMFRRVLVPA